MRVRTKSFTRGKKDVARALQRPNQIVHCNALSALAESPSCSRSSLELWVIQRTAWFLDKGFGTPQEFQRGRSTE
jgi:hypothetical protein